MECITGIDYVIEPNRYSRFASEQGGDWLRCCTELVSTGPLWCVGVAACVLPESRVSRPQQVGLIPQATSSMGTLSLRLAVARSQERMPFLTSLSACCMGYNLFRAESDEKYMWNVKCGVLENIKECSAPCAARKINDPDWLLHKTKSAENRPLYEEKRRSQFKFLCVLWSAQP